MNDAVVTASVDVTALRVVRELGTGGQGTVVLAEVPGVFSEPLAYKEYAPATLADLDVEALEQLMALPVRADDQLRQSLLGHAAWPVALVRRNQTVCGLLMPCAPEEFLSYLRLPTGYRAQYLAMEFLLNPLEYLVNVDLPVTERSRVALLRELAGLLRDLHRGGVVVGDLSPKNILITLRPPRCYLLDCDAMRVRGRSVLPPIETPDWRLPVGEALATPAADRFKFGLLVVRLLQSDQSTSDPQGLRPTQPELAELAAGSLGDPAQRPGWAEWLPALDTALSRACRTVPTASAPAAPSTPAFPPPGVTASPKVAPSKPAPGKPAAPGAAPQPAAHPPRGPWYALGALVTAAVLVICAGLLSGGFGLRENDPGPAPALPPAGAAPEGQRPAPAPNAVPDRVGVVELANGTDPTALQAAEFFDQYFRAVNDKHWDALLAMYDPAGVVDTTDPVQRESFISAMATTVNSDATLWEARWAGDQLLARVTFRSEQAPGYGPRDDPDQVCTQWEITFVLTGSPDSFRILQPGDHTYRPC